MVVLQIITRPAAAGRRISAADAVDMHTDRQVRILRCSEERPVALAAQRLVGLRRQQDLHEAPIGGRRAISSIAKSGSSCGTVTLARSRGSGFTQHSICHSFTAVQRAASTSVLRALPCNGDRMPNAMSFGIEQLGAA